MQPVGYYFRGILYRHACATDAFVAIFKKLAKHDPTFLSRFEITQMNNKTEDRHLISRDRDKLFIATPRLTKEHSRKIGSTGYWINVNNSTADKLSFIEAACGLVDGIEDGSIHRRARICCKRCG